MSAKCVTIIMSISMTLFFFSCSPTNTTKQLDGSQQKKAAVVQEKNKQPTHERFTAEIVATEKSLMKPAQPQVNSVSKLQANSVEGTNIKSMMGVGNYILQVEPPARKPIRITLFGVPEELSWSIDNTTIADLSASGREAFVEFNEDGRIEIIVRSGQNEVFRFRLTSKMHPGKGWQATVFRVNEQGKIIDMFGDVHE